MNIKGIFQTNKAQFILIFVMVTLGMIVDSASQYLMTPAYNNLRNLNFIGFIIFMIISLLCDLVRTMMITGSDYMYGKQSQSYLHNIRARISRYFFKNEIDKPSTIQNDLNANMDQLTKNYLRPIKDGYMYVLAIVFSIGILFSFNWSLVVLTLILTVISLFLPKTFEKMTSSATLRVTKNNEKFLNTLSKWTKGLNELRRYSSFGIYHSSIEQSAEEYRKAAVHQGATIAIADLITSVVNIGGQIILMILCAYLYFQKQIAFGAVITTIQFSSTVMNGVAAFVAQWNLIKSTKDLNKEMSALQKSVEISENHHDDQKINKLEVKNLALQFKNGESISYPDFEIKKGEKILLTGDSGTGKSTLFKLILGKFKPSRGEIVFSGKNSQELKPNLDELGYVAQDNTLFPDTIKNNITMFDNELDDQVLSAIEKANFTKDLEKFSDGLNTIVDLDQGNLSGGQKQKIVLARAMLHHPAWLFIDEGTSAVDSQGTKEILQNLLTTDSTIIMIAHNFSDDLIKMFDRQIKLINGGE